MTTGLHEVLEELERARDKFPPFNSAHEGLAVLYEEYLELQTEVFWGAREDQRTEVIQVAAMALRFLDDVIDNPPA